MKKITITIVMAMLWLNFSSYAQTTASIKPLTVGDYMPDVAITHILNSPYKKAKISDHKGKLILIDFWSTWCSSCITGFPHLDSLQREFGGRIQVLLVNAKKEGDTERGVKIVIDRMKSWSDRPFKLPVVFQDTAISRYFTFRTIPHYIWISPNGRIIAITGKEEVTAANINKALGDGRFTLPVKTN
jgi:thiol-disulfide isomerase/thioredoxin